MNFSKKFVLIFVIGSLAVSLIVSVIMTHYFQTDASKDRFQLTQRYKEIKDQSYEYDSARGRALYQDLCLKCHGEQGRGNTIYPPLYAAKILIDPEPKTYIKVVLKGLQGSIERSDKLYNGLMPGFQALPSLDLAHLLNFTRLQFGHPQFPLITPVDVIKLKIDTVEQTLPWNPSDLQITKK